MRPRSKLRDRLHEATSDAILAAAEKVFAGRGIHAAKVDDIAVQAGVSVGTLYNYFLDRDGLLRCLIEARRNDLVRRMDELIESGSDQPFAVQLEDFLRLIFANFDKHREFFSIALEDESRCGPAARTHPKKETMRALYERTQRVVHRGVEKGELRVELADLLPSVLTGIIRGALFGRMHDRFQGPLADRAEAFARLFLAGAGQKAEAGPHG